MLTVAARESKAADQESSVIASSVTQASAIRSRRISFCVECVRVCERQFIDERVYCLRVKVKYITNTPINAMTQFVLRKTKKWG